MAAEEEEEEGWAQVPALDSHIHLIDRHLVEGGCTGFDKEATESSCRGSCRGSLAPPLPPPCSFAPRGRALVGA